MRMFRCARCGNAVHFENVLCLGCGSTLGFDPATLSLETLVAAQGEAGAMRFHARPGGPSVDYCQNAQHGVCNWLRPAGEGNGLCLACRLNRTIPNLAETGSLAAWSALEAAKKRLVYSLLRLGLPFDGTGARNGPLLFDFVRDATTGHLDGVVTVDLSEADAVERERQRSQLDEPYRSLLGHLRHESGHYYWDMLVSETPALDRFRELFGDERAPYAEALANHYRNGPRPDWQSGYVSAYASAHPWEDWSETWAHYLHMVDTLETAASAGLEPLPASREGPGRAPREECDVYRDATFGSLLDRWLPLTLALNSINRSMGHADFYPFVISPRARAKLEFVHDTLAVFRASSP